MPWTKRTTLIVAGSVGAGLLAWWWLGDNEEGGVLGRLRELVNDAVNGLVVPGARLTHAPYDKTTGVVPGSPQDLADQSGYDLETYSLARAIASEEGRGSEALQLAVGWAIKNRSLAGSGSVTALVTHAKYPPHSGSYGTQRNIEKGTPGVNGSDRYCSTANDPYDGHAQVAHLIQTGAVADTSGGGQYFDRPGSDDDPERTAANRAAEGLALVDLGFDGIRFWGPA